jgi:large subunit ribosomal protein L4
VELLKHDCLIMPLQTVRWLEMVFGEGVSAEEASSRIAAATEVSAEEESSEIATAAEGSTEEESSEIATAAEGSDDAASETTASEEA